MIHHPKARLVPVVGLLLVLATACGASGQATAGDGAGSAPPTISPTTVAVTATTGATTTTSSTVSVDLTDIDRVLQSLGADLKSADGGLSQTEGDVNP